VTYYEHITRTYTKTFGDHGYPEVIIYSVNFQNYVDWGDAGDWGKIAEDMIKAARALERAGAEFGIIATNTMHLAFDEVQAAAEIPFLHVVDATAEAINAKGFSKVGLLGTRFTMNMPFYADRLAAGKISVLVPDAADQEEVNRVIYDELVRGTLLDASRKRYVEIIAKLKDGGAEGVILGCTEIPLLVTEKDSSLPLFDTAVIHAQKALDYAIAGNV
jgi:aspartate racemase